MTLFYDFFNISSSRIQLVRIHPEKEKGFAVMRTLQNMYHLLSKLTPFEIRTLDNALENTCKLDETKIEPMDLLFKYSLYQGRSISTKKVEYAMKKLLNTPNFVSKINVILSQNYKFVISEVIYYYQHQSSINSEGRECIKLLLLYSNVSDVLKKWIYNSLSKQSILLKVFIKIA